MAFTHEIRVGFADVDAAGIVYFAHVLGYCHTAFEVFLESIGHSIPSTLAGQPWRSPVVHAEADYRTPMRHGDRVRVEVATERVGRGSYTMRYLLRSMIDTAQVHAEGRIVHATIDNETFRGIPIPDAFRAALTAHLAVDAADAGEVA